MDTITMETTVLNGIDLERITRTVDAIRQDPERARFRFRARNRWVAGGDNRSTLFDYDAPVSPAQTHPIPYEFTNAEPAVLGGSEESASAVEFLLHALAGSVTTTFVFRAAALGIAIESLFTELEGEIDVRGMLGLDEAPQTGYECIRIGIDVRADCPDDVLDELIEFARMHSPVCNTVMRPVPVEIARV